MKLYEIIRYGSGGKFSNRDTIVIMAAPDLDTALLHGEAFFKHLSNGGGDLLPDIVHEMGEYRVASQRRESCAGHSMNQHIIVDGELGTGMTEVTGLSRNSRVTGRPNVRV